MKKEDLVNKVKKVIESSESSLVLYAMYEPNDDPSKYDIKKVNLKDDGTIEETFSVFKAILEFEILENEDLEIINLSSSDDRKNAVYYYDLEDEPPELKQCLLNNRIDVDWFEFDEENKIIGFITQIGTEDNNITLFKKHYPINLLKSKGLFRTHNNQISNFTDNILRITGKSDFIRIGSDIYILNLKELESFCGFHKLIKEKALIGVEAIKSIDIVDDIGLLKENIENVTFARKLVKVTSDSLVLKQKTSDIIKFAKKHYKNLKTNESGTKFLLDTIKSRKEFIKLLNDDFLNSRLTKQQYDSVAKNRVKE